MCGIGGLLKKSQSGLDETVQKMVAAIRHRGPDDSGFWTDPSAGIALAHTRLSILDVSSEGHQPMRSASGRYIIAFNGEIYNHRELRQEHREIVWRGHSDTETLLACIEAVSYTHVTLPTKA